MLKHLSLPIFLLLSSVVCFFIDFFAFTFVSQSSNFIGIAIIVGLTIKDYYTMEKPLPSRYLKVMYTLLPLICFAFIVGTLTATSTSTWSYVIMVSVALICSLRLFFRHVDKGVLKTILALLYLLISSLIFSFAAIALFLSPFMYGFNVETERISELSPNAVHVVTIIQRSEGALGGSTSVFIEATEREERRSINLLIGELRPRNISITHIHGGRWSEFYFIDDFRWDGDYRLYMYRSPDRHRGIAGGVYVFELVGRTWVRERVEE